MRQAKKQNSKKQSHDDDEIDVGRFFELAEADKSNIKGLNVYEIRDKLDDENRGFELVGDVTINGIKKKTNMRFWNINDFESYIMKIDEKYDGEDVVFEGDVYHLPQPDSNPLNEVIMVKEQIIYLI